MTTLFHILMDNGTTPIQQNIWSHQVWKCIVLWLHSTNLVVKGPAPLAITTFDIDLKITRLNFIMYNLSALVPYTCSQHHYRGNIVHSSAFYKVNHPQFLEPQPYATKSSIDSLATIPFSLLEKKSTQSRPPGNMSHCAGYAFNKN
eukprot:TRINITY_DN6629_c0_g1_i1.p1 TRINITY_DN6629_c0_g1~~TRINITY_DN6629_c0_g1_i1.p1  ORF type:complete len:146 (+),score=13.46 TRINITY_DN6629_c0_g1_i1:133-570(+)